MKINVWVFFKEGFISIAEDEFQKNNMEKALNIRAKKATLEVEENE
jgi:hypothetical protein